MTGVDVVVDTKIAALESRVAAVEKVVDELRAGLVGNVHSVGALELIRTTSASVQSMDRNLQEMRLVVEQFRKERWTIKGIMISVGLLCGLLSWLSTLVLGWLTK